MASVNPLPAIIERLIEKTKAKNPGVDIIKKPPKPKAEKKPRKRKDKCSSDTGWLH
jgi:hypothetical protein